jgi:hypothetical protein
MDLTKNVSKTQLIYDFQNCGNYNVFFTVSNAVCSKIVLLSINVVDGLQGVYINIVPRNCHPGFTIQMNAYVMQGDNVSLEWFVDGQSLGSHKRTCKNI